MAGEKPIYVPKLADDEILIITVPDPKSMLPMAQWIEGNCRDKEWILFLMPGETARVVKRSQVQIEVKGKGKKVK